MPAPPPSERPRGPRPTPRPGARPDVGGSRPVAPTSEARRAALARAAVEAGGGSGAGGAARPARAAEARPTAPEPATAGPGPAAPTIPGYLPALDGLRAISVAAVVAYHLGRLEGGFLGVDVFFVISGFLITRLLLA